MSGDEAFLKRWSRRKRAAADARPRQVPAPPVDSAPAAAPAEPEPSAPLDLPLPESISSASDVRGFLGPRVPLELTRAALRRAWLADPEIRDFIGLSENAWDFNAPDGVPGFGPLDSEQVSCLIDSMTRQPETNKTTDALTAEGMPTPPRGELNTPFVAASESATPSIAAPQHGEQGSKPSDTRPKRGHGSALPQ